MSAATWAVQWWETTNKYGIVYCHNDIEAKRKAEEIRREIRDVTTVQVIWIESRWDAPKDDQEKEGKKQRKGRKASDESA